jgi:hypothetical protein
MSTDILHSKIKDEFVEMHSNFTKPDRKTRMRIKKKSADIKY